jgi:hypothetical protein
MSVPAVSILHRLTQLVRRRENSCGIAAGLAAVGVDASDAGGNFPSARCCFLSVAGDLVRRGALLLHGGCNGTRRVAHSADGLHNALDRLG